MRYYSENRFYIKIKNNLDEEITLEELVDQYFGNAEDYFKLEDSNSKNNPDFTTITTTEEQHQEESQEEKEKNNFSKGGLPKNISKRLKIQSYHNRILKMI